MRLGASTALVWFTANLSGCSPQPSPAPVTPVTPPSALPVAATQAPLPPPPIATIEVHNPSAFARLASPLRVTFYDLGLEDRDPVTATLALTEQGAIVPTEPLDENFDGVPDGLLALIDFDAAETKRFEVVSHPGAPPARAKLTQAELSHKVGGEWRPRASDPKLKEYVGGTFANVTTLTPPPEHTDHSQFIRYEGPGIESDRVAYRIYLDERNGFDIFGKKVATPVLQRVGLDGYESYHHMSDWGMDILKVGKSLGTGGFGYFNPKTQQVELVSKVSGWDASVTRNGDFQSSLRIVYEDWQVAKQTVQVTADFAMTGGSRLVHTRLQLSQALPNIAIGLVEHPGVEIVSGPSELTGAAFTYLGTWGKQSLNDDHLGMAVLYRVGDVVQRFDDAANVGVALKPAGNHIEYYFLAAWAGEPGGLTSKEAFVASLEREIEQLTLTHRVRLKSQATTLATNVPLTSEVALAWAKRLADSELERKTLDYRYGGWDHHRKKKPGFEYDIVGLQPLAYDELNQEAPDARYAAVLETVTGSFVTEAGTLQEYDLESYNIDAIAPGRNLLRLFETTGQKKYESAARTLRRQLEQQPRTRGGAFWHKQKYPSQLWLDGVYMGMPFLARYSASFEQGKSFGEVVKEFTITREQLRDPRTGLYFHAWDESKKQSWADATTGRSPHVWARGMGWFAMALVDVLDVLPASEPLLREPLLQMVRELAQSLVAHQDETGTWWQIVDQPLAPGNYRESSASAMFTYFFAKAVRMGYLHASYRAVASKAYQGLLNEFVLVHPDGRVSMTQQCLVGGLGFGRDGSYRYYMSEPIVRNDPKGNGPFILAGVELSRLLRGEAAAQ